MCSVSQRGWGLVESVLTTKTLLCLSRDTHRWYQPLRHLAHLSVIARSSTLLVGTQQQHTCTQVTRNKDCRGAQRRDAGNCRASRRDVLDSGFWRQTSVNLTTITTRTSSKAKNWSSRRLTARTTRTIKQAALVTTVILNLKLNLLDRWTSARCRHFTFDTRGVVVNFDLGEQFPRPGS